MFSFLVPFLFSLKTSPGVYIIYRIVNCVSVICKLCHSGMVVILVNNSSCGLVVYRITTIPS